MTYADSAPVALGMSRNRPPEPVAPSLERFYVLATDLEIGDHIQDRGARHVIDALQQDRGPIGASMIIFMEDGGSLTVPLHQHLTVWREAVPHV